MMDDAEREQLNALILESIRPNDPLLDPKFIEIYRKGWRNKHQEIEEGAAAGIDGARSLAGILALVRDSDFLLAMTECLNRLGYVRLNGDTPLHETQDWIYSHMDQVRKRY